MCVTLGVATCAGVRYTALHAEAEFVPGIFSAVNNPDRREEGRDGKWADVTVELFQLSSEPQDEP